MWAARAYGVALSICFFYFLAPTGALATDLYIRPVPRVPEDVPYVPPALWPGFYLGGHVGGAWNAATADDHYVYVGDPEASNKLTGIGVIAGAQAGYNYQWGNVVFGPEADLGYLGLGASRSVALPIAPECTLNGYGYPANYCGLNAKYSNTGGLYGDITGRLGYAAGPTLFYAKGGAALLNAEFKANYTGQNCLTARSCIGPAIPSQFNFDQSGTLWGWTMGAGIEYSLSQKWSVKLEYQHFAFNSMSMAHNGRFNIPCDLPAHSTLSGNVEVSPTVDSVMLGVNYHLNLEPFLK